MSLLSVKTFQVDADAGGDADADADVYGDGNPSNIYVEQLDC